MKYYYPRDSEHNNMMLTTLKDVWEKYRYYKDQSIVITSSLYPRLSTSKLRGKKASIELLKHMFQNIPDVPLKWDKPEFIFILENIKCIDQSEHYHYIECSKDLY